MNPRAPEKSVWIFLLVFLVAAWVALVWLAVIVTETVVAMLEYVVELAQLY
jgi:ABC-type transporter Mla subunit MlaD